jgi:hypothetical protein
MAAARKKEAEKRKVTSLEFETFEKKLMDKLEPHRGEIERQKDSAVAIRKYLTEEELNKIVEYEEARQAGEIVPVFHNEMLREEAKRCINKEPRLIRKADIVRFEECYKLLDPTLTEYDRIVYGKLKKTLDELVKKTGGK